jgi:hypothetical protein
VESTVVVALKLTANGMPVSPQAVVIASKEGVPNLTMVHQLNQAPYDGRRSPA